jgi:hypothetical protein
MAVDYAKVYHHENNVGTLVATLRFKENLVERGEDAARRAVEETLSRVENGRTRSWRRFPWTNATEHARRDTRPADRILIEYADGSNDIFTVESVEPVTLYHGAK